MVLGTDVFQSDHYSLAGISRTFVVQYRPSVRQALIVFSAAKRIDDRAVDEDEHILLLHV